MNTLNKLLHIVIVSTLIGAVAYSVGQAIPELGIDDAPTLLVGSVLAFVIGFTAAELKR